MKIKIESDGTLGGTVVKLPDGTVLGGIQWVQVFLSSDEMQNEVILSLANVELDLLVDANVHDNDPVEDLEGWDVK